jgi:diguanylate cyclase
MNNGPVSLENASTKAAEDLDRLNSQVATMRGVLVQLLQDIVRAENRLDRDQAAQLVEANEHLVLSAVGALNDAESAHGALDEAARIGSLDPLTGLPNRTLLLDRFETAIANAKRHGNRVALLFVDLNAFKQINDTLGHAAGDRALQSVADCLSSLVRETDTVSRHGGDEFLILLAEVAQGSDAAFVAEKVNNALSAYGQIDNHEVNLTASIGISVYPDDGEEPKILIERADAAMYLAKRRDTGAFMFHGDIVQAGLPSPSLTSEHRRLTHYELTVAEYEARHEQLRDVNENLVLAALGAQELLAAAEETKRRQAELLALVASELSSPFAPIRLAAATLGMDGAETTLLPRVQAVIEQQADKILRMVADVLGAGPSERDQMTPDRARFEDKK